MQKQIITDALDEISNEKTFEKEGCIILNKPFIGGYIDQSNENEAHELINFFLDDRGNHFIYCNPYGQNVANANNKEIEYLIFTSSLKNKCFYIEYIIEISESLHTQSISKTEIATQKAEQKIEDAKREIKDKIKRYGYENIDDIKYGGISITSLFTDAIKVIPLTFLAKGIYKLKNPIKIDGNSGNFDYNFQRNFGYVTSESKTPKACKELKEKIDSALQQGVEELRLEKFDLNGQSIKTVPTFLDLISMYRQEECYTQILYKLFNYRKELIPEFLQEIGIEANGNDIDKDWHIKNEYVIKNVGRLDLFIFNDNFNIIIENKVDSGINYVSKKGEKTDQLTRYYQYFENPEQKDKKKNLYLIFAPNEKIGFIKAEIESIEDDNAGAAFEKVIGYKTIYEFFKKNQEKYTNFEYKCQFNDVLEVFRRLSLTRQKMCEENLLQNIYKIKQNP